MSYMYVGTSLEYIPGYDRVSALFAVDSDIMNEDESNDLIRDYAECHCKRLGKACTVRRPSVGRGNLYEIRSGSNKVVAVFELKIVEKI